MKLTKRVYRHHYKLSVDIPRRPFWLSVAILSIGLTTFLGLAVYRWATSSSVHYINPSVEITPTPTPEPVTQAKTEARKNGRLLEGEATIYTDTLEGCLGCRPYYDENGKLYFVMANGERLDCERKTVACGVGTSCNQFPLGTVVVVQNVENGMFTTAEVTDTGGFGKLYGRILDMTPAVARAINLNGKGQVRVWPVEGKI
jgi:3D (Asp-Asp-Asp) domain-containing protein